MKTLVWLSHLTLLMLPLGCTAGAPLPARPGKVATTPSWTDFRAAALAVSPEKVQMGSLLDQLWTELRRQGLPQMAEAFLSDCDTRAIYVYSVVGVGPMIGGYERSSHRFFPDGPQRAYQAETVYIGFTPRSLRLVSNHTFDPQPEEQYKFDLRYGVNPKASYCLEVPLDSADRPRTNELLKTLLAAPGPHAEEGDSMDASDLHLLITQRGGRTDGYVGIDAVSSPPDKDRPPNPPPFEGRFWAVEDLFIYAWKIFGTRPVQPEDAPGNPPALTR